MAKPATIAPVANAADNALLNLIQNATNVLAGGTLRESAEFKYLRDGIVSVARGDFDKPLSDGSKMDGQRFLDTYLAYAKPDWSADTLKKTKGPLMLKVFAFGTHHLAKTYAVSLMDDVLPDLKDDYAKAMPGGKFFSAAERVGKMVTRLKDIAPGAAVQELTEVQFREIIVRDDGTKSTTPPVDKMKSIVAQAATLIRGTKKASGPLDTREFRAALNALETALRDYEAAQAAPAPAVAAPAPAVVTLVAPAPKVTRKNGSAVPSVSAEAMMAAMRAEFEAKLAALVPAS